MKRCNERVRTTYISCGVIMPRTSQLHGFGIALLGDLEVRKGGGDTSLLGVCVCGEGGGASALPAGGLPGLADRHRQWPHPRSTGS